MSKSKTDKRVSIVIEKDHKRLKKGEEHKVHQSTADILIKRKLAKKKS